MRPTRRELPGLNLCRFTRASGHLGLVRPFHNGRLRHNRGRSTRNRVSH